jgi:hypothetical protein
MLPRTVRDLLGEARSRHLLLRTVRDILGEAWSRQAESHAVDLLRLVFRGALILLRWSLDVLLAARPAPVVLLYAG